MRRIGSLKPSSRPTFRLLRIFRRLASERVPVRLALTMTPTLCAMLRDPLLQHRTERYLDRGIELSDLKSNGPQETRNLNESGAFLF